MPEILFLKATINLNGKLLISSMENNLVEVIKEGEIVKMPKWQAQDEDLFILRNISDNKIKVEAKIIDFTSPKKTKIKKVESWNKNSYKRNNVFNSLIDNFHWQIIKVRRSKGLTRKQLADKIGEDEKTLKIIENGGLPEDNFFLIGKIEKFLSINLRKEKPVEAGITLADLQKMDEKKVLEEIDKSRGIDSDSVLGKDIEIID